MFIICCGGVGEMMVDKKMKKKIKFALVMNNKKIRTLSELRENFSLGDILDDFVDLGKEGKPSKLCEWLIDRHHTKEAEKIKEIQDEWANQKTNELSQQEKIDMICRIQNVFLSEKLIQNSKKIKKESKEEIERKYDILTKREFDNKYSDAKDNIDYQKFDEDIWRKYLSRLAWDNKTLQQLIKKDNKRKIYLILGKKGESFDLPVEYKGRFLFEGLWVDDDDCPRLNITENGDVISEKRWKEIVGNDTVSRTDEFVKVKLYVKNDRGEEIEWNDKTVKTNRQGYSKANTGEANSESAAKEKLARYMDAQYPMIYFRTYEEDKADEIILSAAGGKKVYEWNVEGFFEKTNGKRSLDMDRSLDDTLHLLIRQYESMMRDVQLEGSSITLGNKKDIIMHNAVLVLKDVHELLKDYAISAQLKYLAQLIYKGELEDCNILIVSPMQVIPKEIENYIVVLNFSHLSVDEIGGVVDEFCIGQEITIPDVTKNSLKEALKGLTEFQIVNILALAYAGDGAINIDDLEWIREQKKQIIRKAGILEIVDDIPDKDNIGGLNALKSWIDSKSIIFKKWDVASKKGVDKPKGILIAGMPGCGKSLCAKATAGCFGDFPLLRMDMGKIMGKYVGESEENMRQALRQADAIAPCVLWIDELEKAFAGIGGGGGAAEVTTRLFGTFLTWMQEKKSLTFIVATANDISVLPPELMRKGRFDEVCYIDLPNYEERKEIFEVHIKKRKYDDDLKNGNIDLDKLAESTEGFSGAGIEGIVKESIEKVFLNALNSEDYDMHLTTDDILEIRRKTSSLKEMRPEAIDKYKSIYEKYKFRNASNESPMAGMSYWKRYVWGIFNHGTTIYYKNK